MKIYRRRDKRIIFDQDIRPVCYLVHPFDRTLQVRARLLDIGIGGFGLILHEEENELPDWASGEDIVLRVVLPGSGRLIRRTGKVVNQREANRCFGFQWDQKASSSSTYESLQARRVQQFLLNEPGKRADLMQLMQQRLQTEVVEDFGPEQDSFEEHVEDEDLNDMEEGPQASDEIDLEPVVEDEESRTTVA